MSLRCGTLPEPTQLRLACSPAGSGDSVPRVLGARSPHPPPPGPLISSSSPHSSLSKPCAEHQSDRPITRRLLSHCGAKNKSPSAGSQVQTGAQPKHGAQPSPVHWLTAAVSPACLPLPGASCSHPLRPRGPLVPVQPPHQSPRYSGTVLSLCLVSSLPQTQPVCVLGPWFHPSSLLCLFVLCSPVNLRDDRNYTSLLKPPVASFPSLETRGLAVGAAPLTRE